MENGTLVLARNPSRLEFAEAIKMDLLIARETQPAQTLDALVRADERLTPEFPKICLRPDPHGTNDGTDCRGSSRCARRRPEGGGGTGFLQHADGRGARALRFLRVSGRPQSMLARERSRAHRCVCRK